MIMDTNFLTPSLVHLCVTTATVAAHIMQLDIVFFHAVGTNALPKWDSCIAKATCRCYCVVIGLGCCIQQHSICGRELLNLVRFSNRGLREIRSIIYRWILLGIIEYLFHKQDSELDQKSS